MWMPVSGVAVDNGLLETTGFNDPARRANCISELPIRHRPVSRDFSAAGRAMLAAPLVHRRGNAVANASCFPQLCLSLEYERLQSRRYLLGELQPPLESFFEIVLDFLLDIDHGVRVGRPFGAG